MFSNFDPELKISYRYGKVFDPSGKDFEKIKTLPDVAIFSEVLQDNALVKYRDKQTVAVIKGVDDNFESLANIDSILLDSREGKFIVKDEIANYGNAGVGLASLLGVRASYSDPLEIYVPRRDEKVNMANPATSFNMDYAFMGGVYCTNQQIYDDNFLILPLDMVRSLLKYDKEVSAVEIALREGADAGLVRKQIQSILGDSYQVKDRYQQQESSFKMMEAEKLMIFLILSFILILALFNVIGSISMLMIEKRSNVKTLNGLGADNKLINKIFLYEGWMISMFGALLGIVIGVILCLLQENYGFIKLGQTSGAFVVDAYPVKLQWGDIAIIFVTVMLVGFVAAWYPVRYLGRKWLK
jgi:ABC-type lipoprotein release transport system permease subunit